MRTAVRINSLINRENTGNFSIFWILCAYCGSESPRHHWSFSENSLLDGSGNFKMLSGNYFAGSGNLLRTTGKLILRRRSGHAVR